MSKKISIIGGDLRSVFLAELYTNECYEVYTYGLEKVDYPIKNLNIHMCNDLEECLEKGDIIIGPIPFSQNGIDIKAPFSNNQILIENVLEYVEEKELIAGSIKKEIYDKVKNKSNVIDIMENEELAILNSISTAEGTMKIAMEETYKTIHGSNVLILGFGRLGKVLARMFKNLDAKVFCEARKQEDLAWIKTYGYNAVPLNKLNETLKNKQIIINTIPHMMLDEERLNIIDKECLIIDLASKPGGVDVKAAEKLNINVKWALGIPRNNCTI